MIGIIRCGSFVTYSESQLRDLTLLATQVSVRLAQIGVTPSSNLDPSAGLTKRQLATIHLAVQGLSNGEIARDLKISENSLNASAPEVASAIS